MESCGLEESEELKICHSELHQQQDLDQEPGE